MTRISVALATYNGAQYLDAQLRSIAGQTLLPAELVACDDGSTDGSDALIERFASRAAFPVRLFRNGCRLNYRANFMQAALGCRGELIAFCDQDDIWRADKLAVLAAEFADPEVLLAHHNARIFGASAGISGVLIDAARRSEVHPRLSRAPFEMAPGFTQMFRRSLLAPSDLRESTLDFWSPGEAAAHDQWIFLLASSLGKVSYVAEALADYRQHGGNLFGASAGSQTPYRRILDRLTTYRDYAHLEIAFSSVATALAGAALFPGLGAAARHAVAAARWYGELSEAYGERRRAYAEPSLRARGAAWARLRRAGRYAPGGSFYFADHGVIRDFVQGVCLARLRRRANDLSANDESLRLPAR
jgi:glycosyltransferase involved in cell wall biosynthesis